MGYPEPGVQRLVAIARFDALATKDFHAAVVVEEYTAFPAEHRCVVVVVAGTQAMMLKMERETEDVKSTKLGSIRLAEVGG